LVVVSSIFAVLMAIFVIFIRIKAARKPTNAKKIILPPFFMATGFLMFLLPQFRLPLYEVFEAFFLGCLFSILLIKTSKFEVRGTDVFLKRSKLFIVILFGLLAIRLALKAYVGNLITYEETSGLFFILAFGMILPWRVAMFFSYKNIKRTLPNTETKAI
jgi:membrane protein CcdC involved in cytochrome C biogenesis